MPKIERRRKVVPLLQGNYEVEMTALLDKAMAAQRAEAADDSEASGPPLRAGQKAASPVKRSVEYAKQYDALLTEAEESAVGVTVWAIGHEEWTTLADAHPPREDIPADEGNGIAAKAFPEDKQRGVNTKTFPPLLLRASLVEPLYNEATGLLKRRPSVDELVAQGSDILSELGLTRLHYVKLETAAWNVNVGDDTIPKGFSLVSFLSEKTGSDSEQPNDLE